MQQHTPNQKRKQLAIRYFTYGVMSLAVAVISAVCIFLALGYWVKDNNIVQRGLIQFRSVPSNARIVIDNQELTFRTPGKWNVDVGQHTVTMKLDGYRDWTKTVTLDAGELRWLNYARLIPKTVTTTSVKEFANVASSVPSPDRKWIALITDPAKPEITMADLRSDDQVKFETITLPPSLFAAVTGQTNHFQVMEWDFGARYILVKHTVADKTEFIRVDRSAQTPPLNVSASLGVSSTTMHFSGTSGNVFYARDAVDLRKLDVAAGTISSPIASQVGSFVLYKTDTLSYVNDKGDRRHVGVYLNAQHKTDLRTYDITQPILSTVSDYFGDTYVAVARGTSVEIIKNPLDKEMGTKAYRTVTLPVSASWLEFSNNGRFVIAGTGTQFVTYDLETDETFSVNVSGKVADTTRPLQWLDDYTLVTTADQSLRLTEFDGGNQQVITDAASEFSATLNDDGSRLYSIAKTTGGYSLQVSRMTVED